jgi:hypothetical protein
VNSSTTAKPPDVPEDSAPACAKEKADRATTSGNRYLRMFMLFTPGKDTRGKSRKCVEKITNLSSAILAAIDRSRQDALAMSSSIHPRREARR